MLVVRAEQMKVVREARVREFHRGLLRDAECQYPHWRRNESPDERLAVIYGLVSRAQSEGSFQRDHIRHLVLVLIPYEPNFESHAALSAILSDPTLMGSDKAVRIEALLPKE